MSFSKGPRGEMVKQGGGKEEWGEGEMKVPQASILIPYRGLARVGKGSPGEVRAERSGQW